MYIVKEVAELLGVSVHTVRYYDDKGLIPGTKRNAANQRLFDDMEVEWLFVSLTLKNTGLSLKDVKHYIELYGQGDSTLPERIEPCRYEKNNGKTKRKNDSGDGRTETPSCSTRPEDRPLWKTSRRRGGYMEP